MADDILVAARVEERRLEAELQNHPIYRKLVAVRALIELYVGSAGTTETVAAQLNQSVNTAQRVARARDGSAFAKVGTATEAYLRRIGRRAQSPEIARALEAEGFEFDGRKAVSALASALSHNPLFDNVPKQGYGLREWSQTPSNGATAQFHGEATTQTDSVDSQLSLVNVHAASRVSPETA